ncbi:MAG: helix-turn-helix domain-containing protein [Deltaproteobacteria bacterium]|nr:helix-turn-helix domain-containing protein [Deltaproteobacteria bacterium]
MPFCDECGAEMGPMVPRDMPYDCDITGVVLRGVGVSTCTECDNWMMQVPNVQSLHKALAAHVIENPGRLTGPEIRFLRKYLGWSGRDFAREVDYNHSTVSRWENGRAPIPRAVDRLLRAYALRGEPIEDYESLGPAAPPSPLVLSPSHGAWKIAG